VVGLKAYYTPLPRGVTVFRTTRLYRNIVKIDGKLKDLDVERN
jgi:hypothetical protein